MSKDYDEKGLLRPEAAMTESERRKLYIDNTPEKIEKRYQYPQAAEVKQPTAAQPSIPTKLSDMDYINDRIAKMTAPKAAEIGQPQVAQIGEQEKKHLQQIIDEYIARMTAPSAAEQPIAAQPDYPDEYKPRSR